MGVKAAIDNGPGTSLYASGLLGNINDGDPTTRVDNWSNGTDGGRGVSYVGIVWPVIRYEQITSLALTLATFGDGGWFGPNGAVPAGGQPLAAQHLTTPSIQVTTNAGASWRSVSTTSDYLTVMTGATIGGPASYTVAFTLNETITNINGIRIIGTNGGNAGPDANGFIGVFELAVDSTFVDSDSDGMPDEWEKAHHLNVGEKDAELDKDLDGLANGNEYISSTDPEDSDTDGDGYSDGVEGTESTDPKDPASIPGNLARQGTPILGTEDAAGLATVFFNAGSAANLNDQNLATRADTFNGGSLDKVSFVGITWDQPQTNKILRLELTLATFFDGGWFGPNNRGPGAGNKLNPTFLTEPNVQVTPDGAVWTNVSRISDYLTVMNGHGVGGGTNPNPTIVTTRFILDPPVTNIMGVRIIGSEGGTASGGFLGVSELKVYARTDGDNDGMDDDWERANGLVVGVNDSASDQDSDGLTALQEYQRVTNPRDDDTDSDGLMDGAEVNTHLTNPTSADSDADGLQDGAEITTHGTNPLLADTDQDLFDDGLEVQLGSSPTSNSSVPGNLALRNDAVGLLGTMDVPDGTATPLFHAGAEINIHDGDPATSVDTYNEAGADTLSFVGVAWTNAVTNLILGLEFDFATFFDGGWFGINGGGPGAGGLLSTNTDLVEPSIQVTPDGGTTWTNVSFTSDYLAALHGHALPAAPGPPTRAKARFQVNSPLTGINGIRIIGLEGGQASGGFLGVFELAVLTKTVQPVLLKGVALTGSQFRFDFDTQPGSTYKIQWKNALTDATWTDQETALGTGSRLTVSYPVSWNQRFYRVLSQ